MTILRGEVLERNGEERPACLHGERTSKGKKPKGPRQSGEGDLEENLVSNG